MNTYRHTKMSLWAPLATSCSLTATWHISTGHPAWRLPFSENTKHISHSHYLICLWQPQCRHTANGRLSACSTPVELLRVLCWLSETSLHFVHLSSRIREASFIIHDLEPSNMVSLVQKAFCITYKEKLTQQLVDHGYHLTRSEALERYQ